MASPVVLIIMWLGERRIYLHDKPPLRREKKLGAKYRI